MTNKWLTLVVVVILAAVVLFADRLGVPIAAARAVRDALILVLGALAVVDRLSGS